MKERTLTRIYDAQLGRHLFEDELDALCAMHFSDLCTVMLHLHRPANAAMGTTDRDRLGYLHAEAIGLVHRITDLRIKALSQPTTTRDDGDRS